MKSITKLIMAAAAVSSAVLCGAEVINYSTKGGIKNIFGKKVTFKENSVVCQGQSILAGKKIIEIDPAKKYTLKLTAVGNAEKSTVLYAGFSMLDAKGRTTVAHNWQGYPGTLTEVAADAKKGDTVIKVKDGSKWNKSAINVIAANAKADLSDIPNRNIVADNIVSSKKVGDVWELTLKKPLRAALPAGTLIRQHYRGGYLYISAGRIVPVNGTLEIKGTISGVSSKLESFSRKHFPVNAQKAQLVILADWTGKKADVEIKDVTITVE